MRPARGSLVVTALGSNLGDRVGNLCLAVRALLQEDLHLQRLSSVVETPPVEYLEQPPYLNMACLVSTDLPPDRLLTIFHAVEQRAGRTPTFRYGPRTLDLDLILYGERIIRDPGLTVPHPRWRGRSFVVKPLREIAPRLRDPETGWTVEEVEKHWPMEPSTVKTVMSSRRFRRVLEKWKNQ